MTERSELQSRPIASCIGCGCDDDHACEWGCWWLRVDHKQGKGVCSECREHLEAWDRGDRTSHAEPARITEAIAAGEIREPCPQTWGSRPCSGDHDWPYTQVIDTDQCRRCGISFLRHIYTEHP